MQNNENIKTEDFINAYRSFDRSNKGEVLSYYSKCNHSTLNVPAIFVVLSSVIFLLGGVVMFTINQNSDDVALVKNDTNIASSMSKDERVQSVRSNLEKYSSTNIKTNDFDNTPKIDLASFEF
ncbi:MAG: hypothetical protein WCO33_02255 [bacterium]